MVVVKIVVFALGLGIVALTIGSAVRTMVVPRGLPATLARAIFQTVRLFFRAASGRSPSYERRDRIMSLYAPVALLTMPVVWLTIVTVGYVAMYSARAL